MEQSVVIKYLEVVSLGGDVFCVVHFFLYALGGASPTHAMFAILAVEPAAIEWELGLIEFGKSTRILRSTVTQKKLLCKTV